MTCGIHITSTKPCIHCARARQQTATALANVIPEPPKQLVRVTGGSSRLQKTSRSRSEVLSKRVHELHAAGASRASIKRTLGVGYDTVLEILNGPRERQPDVKTTDLDGRRKKAAHDAMMPRRGDAARRAALPFHIGRAVR